jgi:hypothetical protein
MNKQSNQGAGVKRGWTKPALNRLGTIKDVAGPSGVAAQSPIQTRS